MSTRTDVGTVDELHASATKACGLDDFGADDDNYREALGVLLDSYAREAGFTELGSKMSRFFARNALVARLLSEAAWKRYPQHADVAIERPIFVTYAQPDATRHDDVAGAGLGFVEIFTPAGKHIGHLEHGDWFDAPWGVVWTTRDFGEFSNAILVGNFGSGQIAAFNGFTYKFEGFLRNPDNSLLSIDGLWSLTFGNDATAGPANTLFFTAGINDESDGLFGTITPVDGLDGDEE